MRSTAMLDIIENSLVFLSLWVFFSFIFIFIQSVVCAGENCMEKLFYANSTDFLFATIKRKYHIDTTQTKNIPYFSSNCGKFQSNWADFSHDITPSIRIVSAMTNSIRFSSSFKFSVPNFWSSHSFDWLLLLLSPDEFNIIFIALISELFWQLEFFF